MKLEDILNSDYLDILFEKRNKAYGAYKLRKGYQGRLTKSVSILMLFLLIFIGSLQMKGAGSSIKPHMVVKEINLAPPPPIDPKNPTPPPPPPLPPPQRPMVKFTPPIIDEDKNVKEDELPPKVDEITNTGPKNQKGNDDLNPDIVDPEPPAPVIEQPKNDKPFTYVEQMPTFGEDINSYLAGHIKYPDAARESGIEGDVVVRFVVNEDGAMGDFQVIRSIGGGCDAEAIRVLSGMPKWKPGKQNGKAVKVYFTLRVKFKLE